MSPIKLDFTNMMSPRLGGWGVSPDALETSLAERFRLAHEAVETRRAAGEMGFFDLPYATDTARRIQEVADGFGQWFENLVVLGIGGSTMGTRMLRDALLGPLWNEGDGESRDHYPTLYVVDNVDPSTLSSLLGRLDLRKTVFNVVSKSGSTAEALAQFLVVLGRLRDEVGEEEALAHFLLTTDPDSGPLRQIADSEGIPSLGVPRNVGGRFSVLSAVGLWPAAATGIDIGELLHGAARMEERCRTPALLENPAGLLGLLLHEADVALGAPIHVLMAYADRLRSFTLWFQQLWAESLGKSTGGEEPGRVGPTPVPGVGATDQHSTLQLFMEGPKDKVVVFVGVGDLGDPVDIPPLHPGIPSLSYLGGHTLGELLEAERLATAEALRQAGRPNLTLRMERVDARELGELIMLFEIATVYAAALYGVDALDQPGVELSKRLTYGLLGREGFPAPDITPGGARWTL